MSNYKRDLIVVGAGIIGLTSAYYVKKDNPDLSVLVLEKEATHSQGNTGRSAAGYRDLFSTEANFKLSHSSIEFYRHVQNNLGVNLEMKDVGYLFLMSQKKLERLKLQLREVIKNTKVDILDIDTLKQIPQLNLDLDPSEAKTLSLDPIEVGVLGRNCGVLEIERLATFYYEECQKLGVEFRFHSEVKSLELSPAEPLDYPGEPFLWQKKLIKSVILTDGSRLEADRFLITTGAWTKKLLDPLGIDNHIRTKRRDVFQTSGEGIKKLVNSSYEFLNNQETIPFIVLPSHGIYLRPYPKAGAFWVTTSGTTSDQEVGNNFSYDLSDRVEEDSTARMDIFNYSIAPILKAYLKPYNEPFEVSGSWVGYYSLNTQDKAPYIFPALNCIVATGGSGTGVMKADAIGRIVSGVFSNKNAISLYDGSKIKPSMFGVLDRDVGIEKLKF